MHVLKVLRAVTYDATKRIVTAVHTYTSSPGKIMFTNLRIPPINEDQLSTKLDSDQTLGRTGQQEATRPERIEEDTVQDVRWSTSFDTPLISLLGPDTKTTFLSFGATEHDNPQRPRDQSDNVGKADNFVHKLHLT